MIGVRREPDPDQSDIIQRLYEWFANGRTPRWIAGELNRLRIPSPRNSTWAASAIYGHPKKGTGILRNELYAGRLVWNCSIWEKDPDTSRRAPRATRVGMDRRAARGTPYRRGRPVGTGPGQTPQDCRA